MVTAPLPDQDRIPLPGHSKKKLDQRPPNDQQDRPTGDTPDHHATDSTDGLRTTDAAPPAAESALVPAKPRRPHRRTRPETPESKKEDRERKELKREERFHMSAQRAASLVKDLGSHEGIVRCLTMAARLSLQGKLDNKILATLATVCSVALKTIESGGSNATDNALLIKLKMKAPKTRRGGGATQTVTVQGATPAEAADIVAAFSQPEVKDITAKIVNPDASQPVRIIDQVGGAEPVLAPDEFADPPAVEVVGPTRVMTVPVEPVVVIDEEAAVHLDAVDGVVITRPVTTGDEPDKVSPPDPEPTEPGSAHGGTLKSQCGPQPSATGLEGGSGGSDGAVPSSEIPERAQESKTGAEDKAGEPEPDVPQVPTCSGVVGCGEHSDLDPKEPPDVTRPRKTKPCPGCDRQVPEEWELPFAVLGGPKGRCVYCDDVPWEGA